MVSQRQVGAGVGAGAIGLVGGEAAAQAAESERLTREQADAIVGSFAASTVGTAALSALGVTGLGPATTAGLAGVGLGSSGWYLARREGVAPRLTVDPPEEINLTEPIITSFVVSAVTLAGGLIATRGRTALAEA